MARYSSKSWRAFRPATAATALARLDSAASSPRAVNGTTLHSARRRAAGASALVLGLDPGSQRTGFGVVACAPGGLRCIAHGRLEFAAGLGFHDRLRRIHEGVAALVREHAPDEVAIERVFVNRNIDSALKLGQARGAALAAVPAHIEVFEYAPRAIKLAAVGYGAAEKHQVAHMIRELLGVREPISADAADALAVAVCHAHERSAVHRLAALCAGEAGA